MTFSRSTPMKSSWATWSLRARARIRGGRPSIRAGMPVETNAITINKVCASGMKAVALADQSIRAGQAEVVVAGGMENMSNIPYTLPDGRWGARMFDKSMVDLMVHDGLWEIFYGYHMGVTAENIAKTYGISREEQDKLGLLSHQRARKAIEDGIFAEEIVTVEVPQGKKDPLPFDTDERPMDTSLEKMGKLPPAFVKKDGTVTAGNASGINDAAAALVVMSRTKADALGVKPLARIVGYASGGVDPAYMGLGPIPVGTQGPGQDRCFPVGRVPLRAERGLRFPGDCLHARARARPGEDQRSRKRHLPGTPDRVFGRKDPGHVDPRDAAQGAFSRAGKPVHRRGPGHGHDCRGGLDQVSGIRGQGSGPATPHPGQLMLEDCRVA